MQRFQTLNIPDDMRGAAVAIGNFDGVHLGHQAVLDQTKDSAAKAGAPWGVLTFEPHPRTFFAVLSGQHQPPFRLMNAETRAHRLEKLGVDVVFEVPFDAGLAGQSAEAFSTQVLSQALGLSHVVVGSDFCFGKGRKGTVEDLQNHGAQLGIGVEIAQLKNLGDKTISSTNIRKALANADPRQAAKMLGHWHRIDGPVLHGEKRGRTLGFPTANMSLDGLHLPALGVYAVTVDVMTGPHKGTYTGAASIGVRPMFGDNHPNCEVYLMDFEGDLYGETLSVGLVDYLRGEEKFDGLEALVAQMHRDCDQARTILAAL